MTTTSHHSRRQFLALIGMGGGLLALNACDINTADVDRDTVTPTYKTAALVWSPDGSKLAWGRSDGRIEIRDGSARGFLTSYQAHKGAITSLSWSPDGTRLVSGGQDKTVHISAPTTGKLLTTYADHTAPVVGVNWSSDGKRIATIDAQHVDPIWQTPTKNSSMPSPASTQVTPVIQLNTAAFSPNHNALGFAHVSGFVAMRWFIQDPKAKNGPSCNLRAHVGPGGSTYDVSWSPDGRNLAACGADRRITVWELGTCSNRLEIGDLAQPAHLLAWTATDQHIIAGIAKRVQLFRFRDEKQTPVTLTEHSAPITALACSSRGIGVSVDESQHLQTWKHDT